MPRTDITWIVLIIALCAIFCSPLLLSPNKIVVEESYLQCCSFLELNVIALRKDHTIPLWAYHFGGGFPIIRHPYNTSLSPLFYLFILPWGSENGIKLLLFFYYCVGAFGFYLLCRKVLKFTPAATVLTTMIFVFNGYVPAHINSGNIATGGWFFLPLILYAVYSAKEKTSHIFFAALLLALLVFDSFGLCIVPAALFLALWAVIDRFSREENRLVNKKPAAPLLLIIFAVAFLLSAVKSFPLLEFWRDNTYAVAHYKQAADSAISPAILSTMFIMKGPYDPAFTLTSYLGIVLLLLFLISLSLCARKIWAYGLVGAFFMIVSMAYFAPVDIFYLLLRLPFFSSIHEPPRHYFFPVVFTIPLVIGYYFSSTMFAQIQKHYRVIIYCTTLIGIADMFSANMNYYQTCATQHQADRPLAQTALPFFNVRLIGREAVESKPYYAANKRWPTSLNEELDLGMQYFLLKQNIGLINWYGGAMQFPEYAVPKYYVTAGYGDYWQDFARNATPGNGVFLNDKYKGECYFANQPENTIRTVRWITNRIIIDVAQPHSDNLVINQNYNKDWTTNKGTLTSANGLLNVVLNDPGEGKIILSYRPKSFFWGAIVSLATLGVCIITLRKVDARVDHRP